MKQSIPFLFDKLCAQKNLVMKAKFTEVLNDTLSYFLLGAVELLHDCQVNHDLPNGLANELTTKETGDRVVEDGNFKNNDDVLLSKADQIKAFDRFVSDNGFEEYRFNSKWGLQVAY